MLSSTEENSDALIAPLLRVRSTDNIESISQPNGTASTAASVGNSAMGANGPSGSISLDSSSGAGTDAIARWTARFHPLARCFLMSFMQARVAADVLPSLLLAVVTSGKISVLVFLGVYLVFLVFWFPFWLLSAVITEWGVYLMAIFTIFFVGRSIIRLIAFPGASQKVMSEIESEFARYAVRMITSSCNSVIEVASAVAQSADSGSDTANQRTIRASLYDLPIHWQRAKTYRNRVLGVFCEVLMYLYHEPSQSNAHAPDLTTCGNNKLSGDVGNLSGLTPDARRDGQQLLDRLKRVMALMDGLEKLAKPILEAGLGPTTRNPLTQEAFATATELVNVTTELRDYVSSLRPISSNGQPDEPEEELSVDAVRRKFEEQNGTVLDTVKNGLYSIVPMLDPPPHTSIFGFDVLRGCMLSRYRGSRQVWVRRPRGGMIDVLHFPARQQRTTMTRNPRAVLYCNPNAGLIEVATGMSLVGGNVPCADVDSSAQENSWVDFYTENGIDVYVFNYAGYGRSFGTTLCVSGRNAGDDYHPGLCARLLRIFKSCFLTFTPTPETLRQDGVAVAQFLLNDVGVTQLIIHGESIGGVAACGTGRYLSNSQATKNKLSLLLCDRTFCNLEAVAQRLVGGWSGYAIRALAPLWNTDVAGDFLASQCRKVIACDAADAIIADSASLKSGVAIWKELRRGVTSTKDVGWIVEPPLQYRMADWENVCVNDSKYVAGKSLLRAQAPSWPSDKRVTVEEAFHFAACCTRVGKLAKVHQDKAGEVQVEGIEFDDRAGAVTSQDMLSEAWKVIACCDGLTGFPLGISVKRGFDSTVSWLCSCLIFGGQAVVTAAQKRLEGKSGLENMGVIEITPRDFDRRPHGFEQEEGEGRVHPKPIPEVIDKLSFFLEAGDATIAQRKWLSPYLLVFTVSELLALTYFASPSVHLQTRTSSSTFLVFLYTYATVFLPALLLKLPRGVLLSNRPCRILPRMVGASWNCIAAITIRSRRRSVSNLSPY